MERLHDDEEQWQEELPSSLSSVSITVSIATDTQHTADTLPALSTVHHCTVLYTTVQPWPVLYWITMIVRKIRLQAQTETSLSGSSRQDHDHNLPLNTNKKPLPPAQLFVPGLLVCLPPRPRRPPPGVSCLHN